MWHIQMATDEDALYLLLDNGKAEPFTLPPFVRNDTVSIQDAMKKCRDYMQGRYGRFRIKGIPLKIKDKVENDCPHGYSLVSDRANFEYVYLAKDLATLSGKKYHAKRNHINNLLKRHSFEYRRYTPADYEECIALQEAWIGSKGGSFEEYGPELGVTKDALRFMDTLNLKCGMLYVDSRLEAFSIGEKFGENTAIIHIEKANPDLEGAYALINREFVRHEWSDLKYINREEDMGLEGLRKAKLSYYPIYLIEKYECFGGS